MMTTMVTSAKCDFTCFEVIFLGGSAVTQEVVDKVKVIFLNFTLFLKQCNETIEIFLDNLVVTAPENFNISVRRGTGSLKVGFY